MKLHSRKFVTRKLVPRSDQGRTTPNQGSLVAIRRVGNNYKACTRRSRQKVTYRHCKAFPRIPRFVDLLSQSSRGSKLGIYLTSVGGGPSVELFTLAIAAYIYIYIPHCSQVSCFVPFYRSSRSAPHFLARWEKLYFGIHFPIKNCRRVGYQSETK